jgi:hypothetical protein
VLAHGLDVGHQVRGGVVTQFAERGGATAAALVDQNDAVARGIKETTVRG